MFISTLDLFKVGIGPSSSHTMGPMFAAAHFRALAKTFIEQHPELDRLQIRCILKGSLAYTGKGHATDRAVILGLHGHTPADLAGRNVDAITLQLETLGKVDLGGKAVTFTCANHIEFNLGAPLPEHPNGMILHLVNGDKELLSETYFSIGGGFFHTLEEMRDTDKILRLQRHPYPFDSAAKMMRMAKDSGLSVADMKRANEYCYADEKAVTSGIDNIWQSMKSCIESGLSNSGTLPGGLNVPRRAKVLHQQLLSNREDATINDWLCAYAMAVNEENAAGHLVVTAPTNGAAGVVPAVLYYLVEHCGATRQQVHDFLLVAAAIGGIIKHTGSISGAEVGCQGEVGSAAAMAAAGVCGAIGCNAEQIENAAEIALEHHLGMTCDPVGGLVQVPCIERNGFGAIKAHTAAMLARRGSGQHFMPLDNCIAAMKQTGYEMSAKYKETSLGGLAVNFIEC